MPDSLMRGRAAGGMGSADSGVAMEAYEFEDEDDALDVDEVVEAAMMLAAIENPAHRRFVAIELGLEDLEPIVTRAKEWHEREHDRLAVAGLLRELGVRG